MNKANISKTNCSRCKMSSAKSGGKNVENLYKVWWNETRVMSTYVIANSSIEAIRKAKSELTVSEIVELNEYGPADMNSYICELRRLGEGIK